ncbi:hypothetical protein Peur_022919 [Populus x canadensis]
MVQEIRRAWEEEAKPEMRDRHVSMVGWKYPPDEWAKLNVDGCMKTVDANYTMVNRERRRSCQGNGKLEFNTHLERPIQQQQIGYQTSVR